LKSLYNDRFLYFNIAKGGWQWELNRIKSRDIADNIADLMTAKLHKLSNNELNILQTASCFGNIISLDVLAIALDIKGKVILEYLNDILVEGIMTVANNQHVIHKESLNYLCGLNLNYRFAHDHIRQAAYATIPKDERRQLHQKIGQNLLQNSSINKCEENNFLIVDQLNQAIPLIKQLDEKDELVALNLLAGRKLKLTTAYKSAYNYLHRGIKILENTVGNWQRQYNLSLDLYSEIIEIAYLSNNHQAVTKYYNVIIENAHDLFDKIKAYELMIKSLVAQNEFNEAINKGVSCLKLLGEPLMDNSWLAFKEQTLSKLLLSWRNIENLNKLPIMTDTYKLAIIRILSNMSLAVYRASPRMMPIITHKLINISMRYGNTDISSYCYATYGQYLCAIKGDIANGYKFGQLALNLLKNDADGFNNDAKTMVVVHGFIQFWQEPLKNTLKPLQEAYQHGLDHGDIIFAAHAGLLHGIHSFYLGSELKICGKQMAVYSHNIKKLGQQAALNTNNLYRQVMQNLLGNNDDATRLVGECFNEVEILPHYQKSNDRTAIFHLFLNKLILSYLFKKYNEAQENAELAAGYLSASTGSLPSGLYYYYTSLISLALYQVAVTKDDIKLLNKKIKHDIDKNQKKLRLWSQHAPSNFLHKFYLVEAERARVLNKTSEARQYYDRAIVLAQKHDYPNDEALAHELAGQFYLGQQLTQFAHLCLHNAHYAYLRWGATAKVEDLQSRYPQIFISTELSAGNIVTATTTNNTNLLDLAVVLKASQTIAGEILLKPLLANLMELVVENAGAQRGILVLEHSNEWVIEAKYSVYNNDNNISCFEMVESSQDVSLAIIHYVARIKEVVILRDATNEGRFMRDMYILKNKPKSVLCMPLLNQGKVSGILYLENNLATEAFTPERLEILNLLSTQMAISIENARLYANMESKVNERTQELSEKNKDLVKLNREKNEFIGIAAHDLKNPLSAIKGLSEEIQEAYDDMDKNEVIEYAEMIHRASEKMFQLVTNLLDVNAIEDGKMDLELSIVDIYPLIKEVVANYQVSSTIKNITINFNVELSEYKILAHADTISQVLDNIVSNAVKYSPRSKKIFIKLFRSNQKVTCIVQDEGPGLSENDKNNLFGKFNRLTAQPTGGEHSTGLGLFIVKKLVETMKGQVWCETKLGHGASFIFEFNSVKFGS
jgi:signal transduction histidine kinase